MSLFFPLTLSLLLVYLLGVSSSDDICRSRKTCDYGNLPGYWRDNEWPQWQLVDECCQLEDLISRSLAHPANFTYDVSVEASVLIFGDSVERYTLHDLCELLRCYSILIDGATSTSLLSLRL